jgi:hypothetical protein
MANVTPPRNGIPIGTARIGGQMVSIDVHPEYLRWFESLTTRVGGVMGASTTDLTLSAFEDAGIEEQKAALFRLADDAGQFPAAVQVQQAADDVAPGIEELRAQVAELTKAVEALQQGLTA